jgi:hypothetical protein
MKKTDCQKCEFKGYSAEICRYHSINGRSCDKPNAGEQRSLKTMGKALVLGAAAGLTAIVTGIVVGPIIGLNAALGHAVAAKMTVGGGVVGAGVNVTRKWKQGEFKPKPARKRAILLPMYLKG